MTFENTKALANKSIKLVEHFFNTLPDDIVNNIPTVLKTEGVWFGNFDDNTIGIFYLTKDEQERVKININNELTPFPGLFISDSNKSKNIPIAIKAGGLCGYYDSNHTVNMIAFNVCHGASFTLIDHFHELKDLNGKEFKYRVDLAFILGTFTDERWEEFEKRLLELLQHTLDVWRSMQ